MTRIDMAEEPMNILYVTREWQSDQKYGLGRSLLPVIQGLRNRGHQVTYLCQEDAGQAGFAAMKNIHTIASVVLRRMGGATQWENLFWGLMERINMGRLAAKVCFRDGYTHVHHHDPFLALGFRLFALWRSRRVRWGVTIHGFGSYAQAFHEDGALLGTNAMRLLRWVESAILQACDWGIFPTAAALQQLQRDLGLFPAPGSWHVIHHAKMVPSPLTREQARAELGWDADGVYILAVGRIVWLKNFAMAVRACAASGVDGLRLVIVGEGSREELQSIAADLGFADRLQFAVTDDVAPYYRAADVYLSVSRTESFGMANLEAMVAGAAIISTAVGGVPEVLGAAACWVPTDDDEALRVSLQQVLDNDGYRQFLVDRAIHRAGHWPDKEQISEAYERVYRQAMV